MQGGSYELSLAQEPLITKGKLNFRPTPLIKSQASVKLNDIKISPHPSNNVNQGVPIYFIALVHTEKIPLSYIDCLMEQIIYMQLC